MGMTSLLVFVLSILAGVVGSMLGLGGGIIIVPMLTLLMGLDIHNAVAASAVSIIATSTGAAVAYLHDRITNTRVAMLLEVGTSFGALSGAYLATVLNSKWLFLMFGLLMAYSAWNMYRARKQELPEGVQPDWLARRLHLGGVYYDQALDRTIPYEVTNTVPGLFLMFLSGGLAGLLGIGGGAFKVLAMDQVMRMPIKVSTATSNFMIGVTAAASSAVYFAQGAVDPLVAGPVALGVLLGALTGTRLMVRLKGSQLRTLFIPVLLVVAVEMVVKGVQL